MSSVYTSVRVHRGSQKTDTHNRVDRSAETGLWLGTKRLRAEADLVLHALFLQIGIRDPHPSVLVLFTEGTGQLQKIGGGGRRGAWDPWLKTWRACFIRLARSCSARMTPAQALTTRSKIGPTSFFRSKQYLDLLKAAVFIGPPTQARSAASNRKKPRALR